MPTQRAFDFDGEVAIVTGAGSRMSGMVNPPLYCVDLTLEQEKWAMAVQALFSLPDKVLKSHCWITTRIGLLKQSA